VHGDPGGYARAWKLLRSLSPELVTVEISRFSLRYRRRHGRSWQRLLAQALEGLPPGAAGHLAIRRLAAQVALPFEVRAARAWSREHGAPWRPLDVGGIARQHLPRYAAEFLSRENVRALAGTADGSLEEEVSTEYHRARLAYARVSWRLPTPDQEATLKREHLLARRLARLAEHCRVLHFGGWEHLVAREDGQGLWPWLAPLEPLRLLLDEADNLEGEKAKREKGEG
jgi:hypothetical protein